MTKLIELANKISLPIVFTNKDKLSRMVKDQPHQNMVLKCSPLSLFKWTETIKYESGIYVFCDKITDPQNFGSIVRSSLFFGVNNIFTGKKNHCPPNSTVSKTSSGAL
jgi:tRNA G18 (ribose-2'-O)-methylase SpoU